ncbi:gliding motility-associated C-terminal domain-containing protein [Flavobacterium sp. CAU 1735]|uniref:DUF7507 domain-containing protein n=1 Tax=Flavobacterium sp. CAU 1735 TaxID=3140361 RepID=UPI0032619847
MNENYSYSDKNLSYRQGSSCIQMLFFNMKKYCFLFFIFMITGLWNVMFADGSKDFYPSGATGNRAFLYSNQYESGGTTIRSWPFKTLGTHYVYAKVGETIAAASSAQGVGNGRIRLTAPDGTVYLSANNAIGRIASRAEELAGPLYSGQATGANRYQPYTTVVTAGNEGIWKVEFLPSGSETSSSTPSVTDIAADANWTQGTNTELIAAWDVSVRNSANSAWVNGRVYTNILNLHISGSSFLANKAFYGNMYVLTRDGIAYRVSNNGSNGVGFTFFVNNKGFLTASGNPSYKSLDISDPTDAQFRIHDPRSADSGSNVTHKIFYSKPALDLPTSASMSGGTTTWLKNSVLTPTASNITYTGVEGTPDLSGNKGAYIGFDSNLAGTYKIEILGGFPTRTITGNCIVGTNTVFWDGRDGNGNILPAGTNIGEIRVQLFGAEVHFPFIDMEINPGGIIIEQLDNSYNLFTPNRDLVYWDDSDISGGMATHKSNPTASGSNGISSNTNGHKWGLYTSGSSGSGNSGTGSSSFGNEKSMDTWSFVPGAVVVKNLDLVVAAADLEVVSIVPSTTTVIAGQNMHYTVTVSNNGPSAVTGAGFNFIVPAGFTISSVTYVNSQGTVVVVNGTIDPVTGNYSANLNMTNGGQVVFTINGTVGASAGGQALTVEASIIRPADVTDPDATNPGTNPPTDPHLECLNGTAVENCNNIKYNTITPTVSADLAVTKTTATMAPSVGDQIVFTIVATNNGAGNATGVQVVEQLPSGYTYVSATTTGGTFNNVTGLWTIGNMTNGQSYTLTLTATVNATGTYTNSAVISGNESDPNLTNNTSTITPTRAISVINAENDSATNINGTTGATNVVNVYTNDTLNGTAVVPSEVILTTTVPNPNLVLNPNGNVDVIPGTPAGTYTLTYQICEVLNPTNCDTAVVSVTVVPPAIDAVNDSATNINGTTGATNVVNVYTNDTLNGTAVVPSEVILTTTVPNPNLVLNPNGSVDVIPGTPAGTYTLTYQICQVLNPTNCDTAVVSVTVVPPAIDAANDSATNINGTTGATNVVNVYTNDTLNGTAVVPSEVILTTTVPNPNLVLNPNGNVDVIPGTPAGTYTLTYQICQVLNPTNCDTAVVSVTVVPPAIDAANDSATNINGTTGATNVVNVYTNDTLNGTAVVPSEVILTTTVPNPNLVLNPNGNVDVIPGTPAGTYTLTYQICQVLNPTNCDTAVVSVTVVPPAIDAVNDSATNINGTTGATNVVNVYTNDTLNGTAVVPSEVILTTTVPNPNLVLNPNGNVDVIPGTPAGTYTLTYQICQVLNPTNCDTAVVSVTVVPPAIDAANDSATNINGTTGATNVVNVYTNDTLNGTAVVPSEVILTTTVPNPNLVLNPNGNVDVIPGTPAGTYTLTYQICQVLNPTNCDTAVVSVTVVPPAIDASNDSATNINGTTGATNVVNVYTNDTLNGTAVVPSEVILTTTVPNPNLVLNPNGNVDVIPGTPAGTYTLTYQICEVLNPTNCDTAVVSVTVVPPAIDAANDSATNINGTTGATNVVNVYTNDTLNGTAVVPSEVILTTTVPNPNLVLNPNGNVDVIPGTPAGTYTLTYQICEVLNPTNCDTAVVSVTVVPPAIDAVNDSATNINGTTGATNVVNVYTNDTLNGTAVVPSEVILTTTVPNPNLVLNPNGSVDVIPGTPAGTYTLTYQICEVLNPTNCDTAVVSVTVVPPAIDAANDSATNINGTTGATNVVNVYTNDTLNGTAVVPSEVILTTTVPNPNLVLNPNGNVDVIPGTPGGTYTLTYQICQVLNPTNCDTAVVTVFVMEPELTLTKDAANGTYDSVGDVINYTLVVTNTGNVTVTNITVTDTNADAGSISPATIATLAQGQSVTVTATHTITQADLNNGFVRNLATVTGQDPTGGPVTDESEDPTNPSQPGDNGYDSGCPKCTVTTLTQNPAIALVKTAVFNDTNADTFAQVGETITYTFTVTNTGNVTVNGLVINDALLGVTNLAVTPATLAPGAIGTATATYTLTQSDINNGQISNTAIASGTSPQGNPVQDTSGTSTTNDTPTVTTLPQNPAIALVKTAVFNDTNADTFAQVGETITYTFTVTNTGNVTVNGLVINDALLGVTNLAVTPATLAPGAIGTATATYVLTQSDINNGQISNTAIASGTSPQGNPVQDTSGTSTTNDTPTVTTLPQNPAIALVKTAVFNDTNADTFAQVGETITYTFTVTNTGNVTVNGLVINDALLGVTNLAVTPATLAPGAIGTATATYTLTQSDINNGQISNTAIASGTSPQGNPVQDTSGTSTTNDTPTVTTLPQNPAIALVKTAVFNDTNADTFAQVGETITYTFTVTNTGNVTVNGLVINDALLGVTNLAVTPATLAPGAIGTATATYVLTQSDINNGQISNTAIASGTSPQGNPVQDTSGTSTTNDTPTVTTLPQNPAIALVKTAVFNDTNADTFAQVGETITYTFTVTSTGNVTVNGLVINDALLGVTNLAVTPATLAPGAIGTATATYVLTQSDINNGQISNTAIASGTSPQGNPVQDTSGTSTTNDTPTVTTLPQNPAIALVKTAVFNDTNADTFAQVGETITYTFTVTNTGNVTVNGLVINDALLGVTNLAVTPATLAPGAIGTATATYVLTQSDINNGQISNTAIASGTSPQGNPVQDTSGTSTTNDTPTVTILPQNPAIALVKTAVFNDTNADTFAQVGETITYTFTVTNTGNVTVNGLVINDALLGVTNLAVTPATLAPGAIGTATVTYVLTQSDINNGQISNTAIASGTSPQGNPVQDTSGTSTTNDTPTVTTLPQNPAIALVKTAVFNDTNADTFAQVGETITYTFTVTNTGNVTVNGLVINDALLGVTNLAVTPATLAPGAIGTATATYVLTQSDINNGQISNTAIASGTSPQGNPVQDTSGTSTTNDTPTVTILPQNPQLAFYKDGTYQDTNGDGIVNVGDTIAYTFTVTNTGNVTITNITISDPIVTVTGGPLSSLEPGMTNNTTFTALYTITQSDIDEGAVYNLAFVEGTAPDGSTVVEDSEDPTPIDPNDPLVDPACPDCTVTPLIQTPSIALIKTGVFNDNNHDGIAQAGETITYSFTVTNTGNTSLSNVMVTDPLPGVVVNGGPINLAVGASDSTTFTAVYVITQADIIAGSVSNQAFVNGTSPQGEVVTDSSDDHDLVGNNPTVIKVDGCTINVFNAISPNGDGSNDILYIAGIECYPNNEVLIFNRWGVQVFETKGYNNNDKVFKGYSDGRATISSSEPLPDGTYFYILKYTTADGATHEKNGYLYSNR